MVLPIEDTKYLTQHEVWSEIQIYSIFFFFKGTLYTQIPISATATKKNTPTQIPELYNCLLSDLLKAKPRDANLWMMNWIQDQKQVLHFFEDAFLMQNDVLYHLSQIRVHASKTDPYLFDICSSKPGNGCTAWLGVHPGSAGHLYQGTLFKRVFVFQVNFETSPQTHPNPHTGYRSSESQSDVALC